jgi:tetratricopeptide (TPR) repeat protein
LTVRARRGYLALDPVRMLRPEAARIVTAYVAPVASLPPVTSGIPDLPSDTMALVSYDVSARTVVALEPRPAATVRSRIDAGKMALALGKGAGAVNEAAQVGWAAYERGDVESAARALTTAAAQPDAQPWVHYVLGLSHLALGHYRDAAQSWERVRVAAPDYETLYFNLADAYIGQRDESGAIRVLRDAERRWPADPEIQNAIGVIQVRRGALDAAIESFDHATVISPADALAYFNLGRAHQMRLVKRQRYNRQAQRWMGGEEDRTRAVANFQKYVELGGPYVQQAKDALAMLGWK